MREGTGMKIDDKKLRELVARRFAPFSADELRREENVLFVGGNLPERETLETLYDSHYQSHASLFHLTFGTAEDFANGETLARMIKKNFHAHLMARFDHAAPSHHIERSYAAGVDMIDLRFHERGGEVAWRSALDAARAVFPRWSVTSTVEVDGSPRETIAKIDLLLALEVVPLVALSDRAAGSAPEEIAGIFAHLGSGLRRKKASIKPLLPLVYLTTPFVPASAPGVLRGFIDIIDDKRLLAASDLRRILRVKEVEESFESSGL